MLISPSYRLISLRRWRQQLEEGLFVMYMIKSWLWQISTWATKNAHCANRVQIAYRGFSQIRSHISTQKAELLLPTIYKEGCPCSWKWAGIRRDQWFCYKHVQETWSVACKWMKIIMVHPQGSSGSLGYLAIPITLTIPVENVWILVLLYQKRHIHYQERKAEMLQKNNYLWNSSDQWKLTYRFLFYDSATERAF